VSPAEEHFNTLHVRRGIPEDIVELPLPLYPRDDLLPGDNLFPQGDRIWIVDLIKHAGFAQTNGEARRFVRGGAVRLDGKVISDEKLSLPVAELAGKVLQVGKRRYVRFVAPH
jgi:tyrosyl-tRNA synthetase